MTGFTEQHKSIILDSILKHFPKAAVAAFGSRTTESFRKDSDLDLLVETGAPNDFAKIGLVRDQLENDSRLPFRVDLVFRDQISEGFLKTISGQLDRWR